jgi:hypothetical protein
MHSLQAESRQIPEGLIVETPVPAVAAVILPAAISAVVVAGVEDSLPMIVSREDAVVSGCMTQSLLAYVELGTDVSVDDYFEGFEYAKEVRPASDNVEARVDVFGALGPLSIVGLQRNTNQPILLHLIVAALSVTPPLVTE